MRTLALVLATWFSVAASVALAQSDSGYQPYVRSRTTNADGKEVCLYLRNRTFEYTVDAAGYSRAASQAVFDAIDASFRTWQAVSNSCTDVTYVKQPPIDNPQVGYDSKNVANNLNVITFREQSCTEAVPPGDDCELDGSCANKYRCWEYGDFVIALATTSYSTRLGAIYDADIEFNAATHSDGSRFFFTAVSSPKCPLDAPSADCASTDIQNTLTHEIGHAMGFDHAANPTSTMAATAPPGETNKRIIDSGTIQGFCEIYPRNQPAASCEATNLLRKQVVAITSGTGSCASQVPADPQWLGPVALALASLLGPFRRRLNPGRTQARDVERRPRG